MRIIVRSHLGDLAADMAAIPRKVVKDGRGAVREGIKSGNALAKANARRTAGKHGKLYPRAFSSEMHGFQSALSGGGLISGEYGPDAAKPQGGMSFEDGSRNQPPHRDMAKSLDVVGPEFARKVHELPDGWFW